jgi:excisionase family DNA binding protein
LFTLPEVARYLGDSERHIRRLVAERRIPFLKLGHFVRFDRDDIDEWIKTLRRAPLALDWNRSVDR